MTYNFKKIGDRLKDERKANGYKSQDALAAKLQEKGCDTYSRQQIALWERGEKMPPSDVLLTLCELYNCDLGYLLCEYDLKTRPKTDVAEMTGLTEKAIDALISNKDENATTAINALFRNTAFWNEFLPSFGLSLIDMNEMFHCLYDDPKDEEKTKFAEEFATKSDIQEYEATKALVHIMDEIQQFYLLEIRKKL